MKICNKCDEKKPLTEFHKDKSRKDGFRESCKDCRCKLPKQVIKNCEICNNTIILEGKRKHTKFCSTECCEHNKYLYKQEYDKSNRNKINKYVREYRDKRKQIDPLFKITNSVRNRIREGFKVRSWRKNSKTQEMLGCSFEEFKKYIECKLEKWMSWDNYGLYNGDFNFGWDIDHIIPLSSAKTEEELISLNHYTNLQPLCSKVNRVIKRDILPNK